LIIWRLLPVANLSMNCQPNLPGELFCLELECKSFAC
jgi:hypothetical protein